MVKPVSRDQNRKPNSDELPLQRACHREHSLFAERAPDDLDSRSAGHLYRLRLAPRRQAIPHGRRNHQGSGRTASDNSLRLFDSNLVRHKQSQFWAAFGKLETLSWHREFESTPLQQTVHLLKRFPARVGEIARRLRSNATTLITTARVEDSEGFQQLVDAQQTRPRGMLQTAAQQTSS